MKIRITNESLQVPASVTLWAVPTDRGSLGVFYFGTGCLLLIAARSNRNSNEQSLENNRNAL
jgi:hypothetical protein